MEGGWDVPGAQPGGDFGEFGFGECEVVLLRVSLCG
jgi:hypothetical protein